MSVNVVIKSIFDNKGLKQAENAFSSLGSNVAKVGAILGGALSVTALTQFTKNAVFSASALSAEFEGVNQIFGEAAKSVQAFAKGASYSVGLSETAALQAAKNFGVFASAAGLSGDEAAGFATKLVRAAGDLASFNDVPVDETLAAIRSGLQGQGEPLSRFGILMNEATLKAKAMEMQIISNTKSALTPQQKVLAANALILDELGVAQGDFVNYQDTFGNSLKTVQAEFQNLQAEIGTAMLPAMEALLAETKDLIPIIGKELKEAIATVDFKQVAEDVSSFIRGIVENIDGITRFGQVVGGVLIGVGSLVAVIKTAIGVQTLFNLAVAANPYILAATALIALAGGMTAVMANTKATNAEFDTTIWTTEQLIEELRLLKAAHEDGLIPTNFYIKRQSALEIQLGKTAKAAKGAAGEINRFNNLMGPVMAKRANDAWAQSWVARGEAALKGAEDSKKADDLDLKSTVKKETAAERFVKVQKLIQDTQKKIAKAETDYAATRFKIIKDSEDRVTSYRQDAAKQQASLVQQSIARLTDAFRSASRVSLGDLFDTTTTTEIETQVKKLSSTLTVSVTRETEKVAFSSVQNIIDGLSKRLAASKQLIANASALAADGFSQTFIEQVVETGADTGNELANAILGASPEARSQMRQLFGELETVSETGMNAVARQVYDKFGLATRALKEQSVVIQVELDNLLIQEASRLSTALADAAFQFGVAMKEIKDTFLDDLGAFDGWFAGLGSTIDKLLAKMGQLSGAAVTDVQAALTAPTSGTVLASAQITEDVSIKSIANAGGIVIDSMSDVAGTIAYLRARIEAGNRYITNIGKTTQLGIDAAGRVSGFEKELANLQGAAASGTAAGTVININVKADSTQSQAMVGKTIGNIVTKYVTTGGQVLVSGSN
jgi:hypothetical protein